MKSYGAADEAVLSTVYEKKKKKIFLYWSISA
jgi:hypothetical protein